MVADCLNLDAKPWDVNARPPDMHQNAQVQHSTNHAVFFKNKHFFEDNEAVEENCFLTIFPEQKSVLSGVQSGS